MGNYEIIWVGSRVIQMLQSINESAQSAVRVGKETGEWFKTSIGTRQDDPVSPTTFIAYLVRMMEGLRNKGTGISIHWYQLNMRSEGPGSIVACSRRPIHTHIGLRRAITRQFTLYAVQSQTDWISSLSRICFSTLQQNTTDFNLSFWWTPGPVVLVLLIRFRTITHC
jgi:hypothetical protein